MGEPNEEPNLTYQDVVELLGLQGWPLTPDEQAPAVELVADAIAEYGPEYVRRYSAEFPTDLDEQLAFRYD